MEILTGELRTVRQSLDFVARLLARRPASTWAFWISYLLRSLEGGRTDDGEYQAFLESLRDSITQRLETGRW
jgi:hypothetical protein